MRQQKGYLELHQKVEVQSFMNGMELFGAFRYVFACLPLAAESGFAIAGSPRLRLPEVSAGLQHWAGNDRW